MSEPLWCDVRRHYCRCQDFGRRCDDIVDEAAENMARAAIFGIGIGPAPRPDMPDIPKEQPEKAKP